MTDVGRDYMESLNEQIAAIRGETHAIITLIELVARLDLPKAKRRSLIESLSQNLAKTQTEYEQEEHVPPVKKYYESQIKVLGIFRDILNKTP